MYLLDTMVVSEPFKRSPLARVLGWLERTEQSDQFISVLTIGELTRGLARARQADAAFAVRLEQWIATTERVYLARILAVDIEVARAWGLLADRLGHGTADVLLAATALVHDLTVVTRNVRRFERTGVRTLDPYAEPA